MKALILLCFITAVMSAAIKENLEENNLVQSKLREKRDSSTRILAVKSEREARSYLQKYEHMSKTTHNQTDDYAEGLKRFQKEAAIPVTGKLDARTLSLMNKERCGIVDDEFRAPNTGRQKRYALYGKKWNRKKLKWRLYNYTPDIPNVSVVAAIKYALKQWSDNSKLKFTRVYSGNVHLKFRFVSGAHGDGYPMDGPSGTLAHAFYPKTSRKGQIHFDEAEKWSTSNNKIHLSVVACHELGHALGLKHSSKSQAIMYPYYSYKGQNYKLNSDDKKGIQKLYGKSCFSGESKVVLENGQTISMKQLKLGDSVLSSKGRFSPVLTMLDRNTQEPALFLTLRTKSGHFIQLTHQHLIAVETADGKRYIHADQVRIGQKLYSQDNGIEKVTEVISIEEIQMNGFYAPMTADGTVIVNGIEASCYAVINSHEIAHLAMAPLRWVLQLYNSIIGLKSSIDSSEGIHWYGEMSQNYILPLAQNLGFQLST
ncbi:unnamed protein product [Dimorphilus gyrociliatus]|uniref:Uncharacterized protein n=1 Tax=Dimorphilus gyrociliatus TaxID=2664684 RepID=A0A7I8WA92_9ANNE|nr:unnamed protein product [Dimorphilus gyrociliatus]